MGSNEKKRKLRSGFTTGAAAAAAAKGALLSLLAPRHPRKVRITFLTGAQTDITIHTIQVENRRCASATVIKDAGDDPDVTHRAEVGARVTLHPAGKGPPIAVSGGKGVGTVTKPGLEIPPGRPAINPGPIRMITREVSEVLSQYNCGQRVSVQVFVPRGEELARRTLNARLGIVGGLSILGTTGIERPMSHDAYLATIEKSLAVARACRVDEAVLTTGRRSERFAQTRWPQRPEEAFIQIGDFFKAALEMAAQRKFRGIVLAIFFGKAVKMAQGIAHTHAARSSLTLKYLADWTQDQSNDSMLAAEIRGANTARHAFELLKDRHPDILTAVAEKVYHWARRFTHFKMDIRVTIFNYEGNVAAEVGGRQSPKKKEAQ